MRRNVQALSGSRSIASGIVLFHLQDFVHDVVALISERFATGPIGMANSYIAPRGLNKWLCAEYAISGLPNGFVRLFRRAYVLYVALAIG